MQIYMNSRILLSKLTGVQRYAFSILQQLESNLVRVEPKRSLPTGMGHLWEQLYLPSLVGKNLLWSPGNTGPLCLKNQVVTIHDASVLDHPEWFNPRFSMWYRFLLPKLMKRVRRVITVSEFSKQRLLEHVSIPEELIRVIHIGVDSRFKKNDQTMEKGLCEKLGIIGHYILVVGSLDPRKNIGRVLQAWNQVAQLFPDFMLVVVGSESAAFRDWGFDFLPDRVRMLGHVDDTYLPALYSQAVGFIYASLYEGFGLPPLEAMACGTPTIVSNVASLPEVVGDAALSVDPYNVETMVHAMLRIIEDSTLRQRLVRAGLERVELFTWEKTSKLTLEVLEEAIMDI